MNKSLVEVFDGIAEYFSPVTIDRVGELNVNCSKVKGLYHWHRHDSAEEFFYIHKGKLTIHYKDRDVVLEEGLSIACQIEPPRWRHRGGQQVDKTGKGNLCGAGTFFERGGPDICRH